MWYGIDLTYGIITDDDGEYPGTVSQFTRPSLRDEWVDDGEPDRSAARHRIALRSTSPEVLRAKRYDQFSTLDA